MAVSTKSSLTIYVKIVSFANVVVYISNYLLTRKFLQGSPYMLMMALILAAALYFGGVLTNPQTNIPILLEALISNALQGLDFIPFLLLTMLLAIVATNLMNSIVTGIIGSPIIASVALNYGFPALPIVVLFLFILMSAMLTPAAGVPGAMLHGNKDWLPGKSAMAYAIFFTSVISFVTVVVGIPLAIYMF